MCSEGSVKASLENGEVMKATTLVAFSTPEDHHLYPDIFTDPTLT
jgi:hypothetical protein